MLKIELFVTLVLILLTTGLSQARAGDVVGEALEKASGEEPVPFRLDVRCADSGEARSLSVYRGQLALWNGQRQIRLRFEESRALLALIHEASFKDFDARYGGLPRAGKQEAPLRVSCLVHLKTPDFEKTSVQLYDGRQSDRLIGLAEALLDSVDQLADRGIGIQSLEEGLEYLSTRTLAAETLRVRYVRLPGNATDTGVILQVEHGQLSRQAYAPGRKLDPRVPAPISDACLQHIVTAVRRAAFWQLPKNIRWSASVDIDIGVLDRESHLNAREGFSAEASSRALEQLAGLVDALEALSPDCDRASG